jgi:hypothetical protein
MSTFEINMRKTSLKSLHSEWSESKIKEFYGNHIENLYHPCAVKQHEDGYIIASLDRLEYVNSTNGSCYKIQPSNEAAWTNFTSLKAKADELGTFRLEVPAHRSLDGAKEYVELNSPNNEFGENLAIKMINENSIDSNDVVAWTDAYFNLLEIILPVVKDIGNVYPAGLFDISNLWNDSNGYYLTNLDTNWTYNLDQGYILLQKQITSVASKNLSEEKIAEYLTKLEEIIDAVRNA